MVGKNSQPTWATPFFTGFMALCWCLEILLIVEATVLTIKKGGHKNVIRETKVKKTVPQVDGKHDL